MTQTATAAPPALLIMPPAPARQPLLPEVRAGLAIAQQTTPHAIDQLSFFLSRQLAGYKKLAYFYYKEAALDLGLDPALVKRSKLHMYPWSNEQNLGKPYEILSIKLRVSHRLAPFPQEETFPEACLRSAMRVNYLIDLGLSKNRLAQKLQVHHRTIDKMSEASVAIQQCPWEALIALKDAENMLLEPDQKAPLSLDYERLLDAEAAADQEAEQGPPAHSLRRNWYPIPPMGNCGRCGAGWSNLRRSPEDSVGEIDIYACIICGSHNYQDETWCTPEEALAQTIPQYRDCHACQAPWQHQKMLPGKDQYGNKVFECNRCGELNRIAPVANKPHLHRVTTRQKRN